MLDNDDSSTNHQDDIKVNREIHPWLRERLEERARPLPKWRPSSDKLTLSTKYNQQFLRLSHSGNRLARWVVNHTGLTSMISRAERLISLPRAFSSLISRRNAVGISSRYQILNLPWFRPEKSKGQGHTDRIDFESREEMASNIVGRLENKGLQTLPEYGRERSATIDEKIPGAYISHLISPPISRKSSIDIVDNIVNAASPKASHTRANRMTEINYSNDLPKVEEEKPSLDTRIRPAPLISRRTTADGAMPDTSSLEVSHEPQHGVTITKSRNINIFNRLQTNRNKEILSGLDRQSQNTYSGKSLLSTRRMSLPRIPTQKNANIINTSSPEHSVYSTNRQKATDMKTMPNRLEVQQDRPDDIYRPSPVRKPVIRTAFEVTPNKSEATSISDANKTKSIDSTGIKDLKEPRHASHTAEIQQMKKLGITEKDDIEKDVSPAYTTKDLFYRKPLSIGQRIVQSLPFFKNISRKTNRPAEPIHITGEKQSEVNNNRLPSDSLEKVHPHEEALGVVTLDNIVITSSSDANKTKSVDSTSVKDLKEPRHASHTAEIQQMKKLGITEKDDTEKDASPAYTANDLFYRKSPPIVQRIAQSLPLIKNISHKVSLSSQTMSSNDKKKSRLNDSKLPSNNLEMVAVHGLSDNIDKSTIGSLLTSQLASGTAPMLLSNETSISRKPDAKYDFTRTANNELDLALTPVNRLPATQQEGNFTQSDQSGQYIQRAPASSSSQSTQQTQAGQSSQANITQASEIKPPDENINMNENRPDVKALAREIYPLIRRMIIVERERRPSR